MKRKKTDEFTQKKLEQHSEQEWAKNKKYTVE